MDYNKSTIYRNFSEVSKYLYMMSALIQKIFIVTYYLYYI